MKFLWLTAMLFFVVTESTTNDVWCKDDHGNNVDWSIMYKAPKTLSTKSASMTLSEHNGSQYGYIDSQMVAKGLTNFSSGVYGIFAETLNPLANTLEPIFKWPKTEADEELVYIAYNDQPPSVNCKTTLSGHTKGVVIFNSQTGIWLVHSVPRFPERLFSGNYSFPQNAHINGQVLFCMTFGVRSLPLIATHLLNQRPEIFQANAPAKMLDEIPDLKLLLGREFPHKEVPVLKNIISGINGTPFVAFAKGATLDDDVYSAIIAPEINSDLFVSSWQNGEGGKLGPECDKKFKVLDVESVSFRFGDHELAWQTEHDHSKWAVSRNKSEWLCIGSINRMHSQFKRGGETVCFAKQEGGQIFHNAITQHADCSCASNCQ